MPTRTILNSPIAALGSTNSSDVRNFKTTFTSGGTYSSSGTATVLSLSHTPKYNDSTVVVQWSGAALITWGGYNYFMYLNRDAVTTAGGAMAFRNTGQNGYNDSGHITPSNTYYYANTANNVAITYSIVVQSSGNGSYPMYFSYGSITAWEILS